jgi:hypothetical protein
VVPTGWQQDPEQNTADNKRTFLLIARNFCVRRFFGGSSRQALRRRLRTHVVGPPDRHQTEKWTKNTATSNDARAVDRMNTRSHTNESFAHSL